MNRDANAPGRGRAFRKPLISLAFGLLCPLAVWAGGQWTWVNGANTVGAASVYGTQGVPAANNNPGARADLMAWSDSAGNLWLFGGGVAVGPGLVSGNDLWRYRPSDQTWTWISGSQPGNTYGVYGTRGMAAATNIPGSRRAAATWTDSKGRLWMFGGTGMAEATVGLLSDLWMFDPAAVQWTWMAGSKSADANGSYGTKGTPTSTTGPGARVSASHWVDMQGRFWLFGGNGCSATACGLGGNSALTLSLNDLWMYDQNSNLWTWMSGSSAFGSAGSTGTLGIPDASNEPSARNSSSAWSDCGGNLFLFGGQESHQNADGVLVGGSYGDLWMYNPAISQWTWVQGNADGAGNSETLTNPPSYGTLDTSAITNVPGVHHGMSVWTAANGDGWMFGGEGIDANLQGGLMNDMWSTTGAPHTWVWRNGSRSNGAAAVYGTQGVASNTNNPGMRLDAAAWTDDTTGTFWLFGGVGGIGAASGVRNDLWSFSTGSVHSMKCAGRFTASISVLPIYMKILFGITNDGSGVGFVPGKGLVHVPPRNPEGPIMQALQQALPALTQQAEAYSQAQTRSGETRARASARTQRRAALRESLAVVKKLEVSLTKALTNEQTSATSTK